MTFTIYPAIDMRGGKCVRLIQGDYNKETIYGDSPFDMAKSFKDAGATWIHMVDLDGAKDGKRVNDSFVIQSRKRIRGQCTNWRWNPYRRGCCSLSRKWRSKSDYRQYGHFPS